MAIIYSYPTVDPVREDLILGTDVSSSNKATKNFTIQSIIDLVTVATGDLQTVLALGNVATGFDIDLTNSSFIGGGFRTTGGIVISGTTGIGFTNLTSTAFTGTIATAAQPNITSLGALTALVLDGPISGTNLITSSNLAGAQNDNVVSTLAIKTYVDNQVGLFDTLAEVLANGNTTGGTSIVVSAADNITFTDTSKALFGSGQDLEVNNDGIDSFITDLSTGDLRLRSDDAVKIQASTGGNTLATFTKGAGVDLYFNNNKKLETLAGGAKVTGAFEATTSGTFASLVNAGTYTAGNGVGTAGQILSSTATGTSWVTEVPLYNWSLEGTAIPSGAAVTVTDGANITTTWDAANYDLSIAVTGLPDGTGAANQVTFWSDTDTLTGAAGFVFAGGATGQVTVAGILQAGTLSDGTFSGSAGTYTGGVSITSTDFVGALTGNADTATALASSGAIAITGDTTSTGGPYTYTSGGAISIATTIADTTVTAKVLTNLATPTSSAISATDTILAAMAKLQGQITGLAGSLAFEGTWDASTGNPPSATPLNGQFWIVSVAGSTNLSGITDWLVGDWAIYVNNGAGTDAWQKLDQSNEVLGSGAANKIAKWTSTNTLATGLIDDDGTTVTVGNSGNLIVEGNTTLGDADTDTTTVKGPAIFEFATRFNEGISLGAATYGTAGDVLTSGGGSASVNTWTTPTTGTVTSVGLTETGDALTITGSPVTGSSTINIAGAGSASQYINGALDLVTFPTVDNYVSWTADSDEGTDITVTSGFNLKFTGAVTAGGAGIATDSAVSANEMTIGLINAGGTPGATTFYRGDGQWSVPVGTKTETLAEVLVNGNPTGGTDIAVSAGDDITFTDTSKALFGAGNDLEIFHTGSQSYIKDVGTGSLIIQSSDLFLRTNSTENAIVCAANASVTLYHNNIAKLATTSTGVTVTGQINANTGSILKGSEGLYLSAGGDTANGRELQFTSSTNNGSSGAKHTIDAPSGNGMITLATSGLDALTINQSQDATFTGNVEIDGNLTVDGNIIHGGGGGSHSGKGGTFTGSRLAKVSQASAPLFSVRRPVTGAIAGTVTLTSGSTGSATTKIVAFAFRLNMTEPPFNTLIDCTGLYPYTTGSNYFNFDLTGGGDGMLSGGYTLASSTTNSNILTFNFAGPGGAYAVPGALVTSPTFTFPANTRVASVDVDSATVTLNQNVTVSLSHQIKFDTSDILIFRVRAYGVDQQISYTFDLGYDENTVATVSTATNS